MRAAQVGLRWLATFYTSVHLALCGEPVMNCTVRRDCDLTQYSISSTGGHPDFNASKCYFSWTNESDHVLANELGKEDRLVCTKDIDTLALYGCVERIVQTRSCETDGRKLIAHTVTCIYDCSFTAKEGGCTRDNRRVRVVAPVVASIFLLVLVGLAYMYYKSRDNIYAYEIPFSETLPRAPVDRQPQHPTRARRTGDEDDAEPRLTEGEEEPLPGEELATPSSNRTQPSS